MPPAAAGKPIEIWFQDAPRVGQQATLTYVWALRGSRPPALRDNRHDNACRFGAVCPARAVGAAIVMPFFSSEAMTKHQAEIASQLSEGAHAVLVCDGAGWHQTSERPFVPDNITLLRLPPYAPELNPVENVWEYRRGNQLSLRLWDSYDAIVDACWAAWNAFVADASCVASVTKRERATVGNQGGWYKTRSVIGRCDFTEDRSITRPDKPQPS